MSHNLASTYMFSLPLSLVMSERYVNRRCYVNLFSHLSNQKRVKRCETSVVDSVSRTLESVRTFPKIVKDSSLKEERKTC